MYCMHEVGKQNKSKVIWAKREGRIQMVMWRAGVSSCREAINNQNAGLKKKDNHMK